MAAVAFRLSKPMIGGSDKVQKGRIVMLNLSKNQQRQTGLRVCTSLEQATKLDRNLLWRFAIVAGLWVMSR
jgi:hypothetical protein